jgi:hypothetical protein
VIRGCEWKLPPFEIKEIIGEKKLEELEQMALKSFMSN